MTNVHFMVEQAPEGGYQARAVGHSIFTEADTLPVLHQCLRDAVRCHFQPEQAPSLICLHITYEKVFCFGQMLKSDHLTKSLLHLNHAH